MHIEDVHIGIDPGGEVQVAGKNLRIGERHRGAVLRAVLDRQPPIAVFESAQATLVFVSDQGTVARLVPTLESARPITDDDTTNSAADLQPLVQSKQDILADRILDGAEITYQGVASLLPRVVGYTFVSHPGRDEYAIVNPDGSVDGRFGPPTDMPFARLAQSAHWGTLDPSVPIPALSIEVPDGRVIEQIVVADAAPEGSLRVLARRRTIGPDGDQVHYIGGGSDESPSPSDFYAAVYACWLRSQEFIGSLASVEGGDRLLNARAWTSLRMADLTMCGSLPRYGAGPYDQQRHHTFPPSILSIILCLLEWGHVDRAGELLNTYLDRYITNEGEFDYYGPAVAEYGQLLALAARYAQLSGDAAWFRDHWSTLEAVWQRLLRLRADSAANSNAPENARGLIPGLPEADYHNQQEQWRTYYFSGDAWIIRGLTEIARIIDACGEEKEARRIEEQAAAYRADVMSAVEASKVDHADGVFVPPGPTQLDPILDMTGDRHASYCNYRYFAEMVSAGVLDADTVREVLNWRRAHGGELLGMTRFQGWLDDWPVIHYARAMLELNQSDRYILLMYAHLAHHQAVGWLAAYEQVNILADDCGVRTPRAGQVVPSQVTVPLMLRWALAYEPRDEDVLMIAPAVPHNWVSGGDALIAKGLPTRWGIVDLSMECDDRRLTARITLPTDFEAQLRVRLPTPPGSRPGHIDVDGARRGEFDPQAKTLNLRNPQPSVTVTAIY